jgi:hypothetical protein
MLLASSDGDDFLARHFLCQLSFSVFFLQGNTEKLRSFLNCMYGICCQCR